MRKDQRNQMTPLVKRRRTRSLLKRFVLRTIYSRLGVVNLKQQYRLSGHGLMERTYINPRCHSTTIPFLVGLRTGSLNQEIVF